MTVRPGLSTLVSGVRDAVARREPAARTALLVADVLRARLPGPDVLDPAEQEGDPDRYVQHVLHVEPGGAFSIVGLVWRPGQVTLIHDHVTWCVVGVLRGVEHETRFRLEDGGLTVAGTMEGQVGDVTGFAPPGDIHRVRNPGPGTAISLHVYGADIGRLGNSVRRTYDLPVRC
jgi:predicted metal-dependent enzyme (double-stranded beta helix superfamily)